MVGGSKGALPPFFCMLLLYDEYELFNGYWCDYDGCTSF